MSVAELKEKLIHQIEESNDISLLEDISRMIAIESYDTTVFELSEGQISAVAEARTQILNGETLTQEEADQEIDKWLRK